MLTDDLICPNVFWSDKDADTEQVFLIFKDNTITASSSARIGSNVTSGETAPTTFLVECALWYDTKENYIKFTNDSGATWVHCSFPLLSGQPKITYGWTQGVTQVYNGFGFIGSVCYVLPGVIGHLPNGRNEDGSLINKEIAVDRVCVTSAAASKHMILAITPGGTLNNACYILTRSTYVFSDSQPTDTIRWFNTKENRFYIKNNDVWYKDPQCWLGIVHANDDKVITSVSQFKTEQIVTQSDRITLSGIGMPSSKFIDLTLGASGSTYTAPANGYASILVSFTSANSYLQLRNTATAIREQTPSITTTGYWGLTIAVRKGDVFAIHYSTTPTLGAGFFRFYYAEGEV